MIKAMKASQVNVNNGIDLITWTVTGKVSDVIFASSKDDLSFRYDPMGNRIAKIQKPKNWTDEKEWTITWYARDAQGNVLAVYSKPQDSLSFRATEFNIYGSSRIGMVTQPEQLSETPTVPVAHSQTLGLKVYEFSNHLGNVLTTFSDRKIAVESISDIGYVAYYTAEILSSTDYYPFGFQMPGRSYTGDGYRYGFNSMEKDDEVKGSGNSYDFGARIYDPRVGRWLAVDPLSGKYPDISPFVFVANSPMIFIDPDGRKVVAINEEAQEIIRLGLTPEEAKYLKFNRKGMVNKRVLRKGMRKLDNVGGNYECLLSLVKEKDVYEVEVGTAFEVHKVQGDPSSYKKYDLKEILYTSEMDGNWEYIHKVRYEHEGKTKEDFMQDYPDFSTETRPNGFLGIALYSDYPGGHGYSASGNHRVVINATSTIEDQVITLGHELYGHQFFKSQDKDHSHGGWTPTDPNYNHELESHIKDREKESKENYQKHQHNR